MKVNLIGSTFNLGALLWRYGHEAYHECINEDFYDITIIGGLWAVREETIKKPCIALAVGSDVFKADVNVDFKFLEQVDLTLMADTSMKSHLKEYTENLKRWKMPFDSLFYEQMKNLLDFYPQKPNRDVLMYCLSPGHTDMNGMIDFVKKHPFKKITILGSGYQDFTFERFDNVLSLRRVPFGCMPHIYNMHKEYRLYYKEKDRVSIMMCEALYTGLKTYGNDKEYTVIPPERYETVAIPKLIRYMEELI